MSQVIERARDEELHALDIDAWWRFSPGGVVRALEGRPCCFESHGRVWVCDEHFETMADDEREQLHRDEAEFRSGFERIPRERLALAREAYRTLFTTDGVGLRGVYFDEILRERLGNEKEPPYPISRVTDPELVLDVRHNVVLLVAAALSVFLRGRVERLPSVVLAEALDVTPVQLASRLRPLGIAPKDFRFPRGEGPEIAKGYAAQPFREAVSWLA